MGILPGVVLPWQKLKSNRKSNKSTFNNIKKLFRFENRGFDEKNKYSQHLQIKYLPRNKYNVRVKNNTIPESIENKFEVIYHHHPTRHSKTTTMNLTYILSLPSLQYLHVEHVSRIALQIKIQKQ